MGNKKEHWLDPWSKAFFAHNHLIREAMKTKDPQTTHRAIQEHLPEMIAIRDEIVPLPVPDGFRPGLFGTIWNLILVIKNSEVIEAQRDGTLKVLNETIGGCQRDVRRLESGRS